MEVPYFHINRLNTSNFSSIFGFPSSEFCRINEKRRFLALKKFGKIPLSARSGFARSFGWTFRNSAVRYESTEVIFFCVFSYRTALFLSVRPRTNKIRKRCSKQSIAQLKWTDHDTTVRLWAVGVEACHFYLRRARRWSHVLALRGPSWDGESWGGWRDDSSRCDRRRLCCIEDAARRRGGEGVEQERMVEKVVWKW